VVKLVQNNRDFIRPKYKFESIMDNARGKKNDKKLGGANFLKGGFGSAFNKLVRVKAKKEPVRDPLNLHQKPVIERVLMKEMDVG